jgi:hypothetical protein
LAGHGAPRFGLHLKRRHPLAAGVRAGLLTAVAITGLLPYAEEFWRCWRAHPTTRPMPQASFPAMETLRIAPEGGPVNEDQGSAAPVASDPASPAD